MRLRGWRKRKIWGERWEDRKAREEEGTEREKQRRTDQLAAKRTEMGDLQTEPERQRRNRAGGDREKPVGVETQGTRDEKETE